MEILFAPAARLQMLELVAALREEDRGRAARFVEDVECRLHMVADGEEDGTPARTGGEAVAVAEGVRLFYWVRAGDLWVLALKRQAQSEISSDDPH